MLGESTPGWLNSAGIITSIAVSVGVILTTVRKWFNRVLKDAIEDQTAVIMEGQRLHLEEDARNFADLRAQIRKGQP